MNTTCQSPLFRWGKPVQSLGRLRPKEALDIWVLSQEFRLAEGRLGRAYIKLPEKKGYEVYAYICWLPAMCQILYLIILSDPINTPENNKSFVPISQRRNLV